MALIWSFIYCTVASSLPLIQQLELGVQNNLIRLHKPGSPPSAILLLKIDHAETSGYDLHNLYHLNIFYATLVNSLIQNRAKVVVLNLPDSIKQYVNPDQGARLERTLRKSIHQHSNQIVLVARPNTLPSGVSTLNIYNTLLSDQRNTGQSTAPEQLVSYFRYVPNARGLNNPTRRVELFGRFSYEDDSDPNRHHKVKSVAALALEKFYQASNDFSGLHSLLSLQTASPLLTNFWGPADTFPSVNFQLHCSGAIAPEQCQGSFDSQSPQTLRDKLVIVNLPEGKASENYTERSPYGELSIAEVQANLIASLITRSFLTTAVKGLDSLITLFGLVLIGLYSATRFNPKKVQLVYLLDVWIFLGSIGSYVALSLVLFWQGLILPLSIPLLGWFISGSSIITYFIFRQSVQQQQKLAERQAVLLQARKLLYRVATDMHDGPLQELKLVMDSLELLGIHHPSPTIDALLDRLEAIGFALRNQLSNTRTIAEKLEITPELKFGLAQGIQQWLQSLIDSRELNLKLKQSLQPLREPKSDSAWIDAREDIFRFFREAIVNVIRHAQPPNGTATQVSVYLLQQGTQCKLIVENDGTPSLDSFDRKRNSGGYGTKLMTTIASELPNGSWERTALETGGMRVTLKWTIETV